MRDRFLAVIRADFPSIEIREARLATNGWDNDVVIVNEEWVFRFSEDPFAPIDVEVAVLDRLRGKTTLAIPEVELRGKSARYIGYRMIRGSELTPEAYRALARAERDTVARDLARFLVEIHRAISVDDAVQLGVPLEDPESYLTESRTVVDRIGDPAILDFILHTFAEYEQMLGAPGPRSFLYNDLHGDNMGFDVAAGRLNGVFDFGDIAVGDLHREFGPLYRIDRELLETTVREYEAMAGVSLSLRRIVLIQRMDRISDLTILDGDTGRAEIEKVFAEVRQWIGERDIYLDG